MSTWDGMGDDELGSALQDLGSSLAFPSGRPVAPSVAARLEAEAGAVGARRGAPRRAPGPQWRRHPLGWPVAALAAAVVVVLVAVLSVSPSARHAVADWLGLRGVDIRYGDRPDPPAPGASAPPASLGLGEVVSLDEARRRVDFPLLVPPAGRLGPPDQVYVAASPSGGRVSLVWLSDAGLPAVPGSGVGLLLTQFRADVDHDAVRKLVHTGVRIEEVRVDGARGFWFEGEPHRLFLSDGRGQFFEDHSRLAGNTLVWEHGDLTLRLESSLSRTEALRLAESVAEG